MNFIFFSDRLSKSKERTGLPLAPLIKFLQSDKRVNNVETCESYFLLRSLVDGRSFQCCLIYFEGKFHEMKKVIQLLHFKGIHIFLLGKKSEDIRFALEWKSLDFILMPFTKYHIDWMMSKLNSNSKSAVSSFEKEVFFKVKNSRLIRVSLSSIIYFESLGNHVKIILNNSQRLVIYSTMKALEQRLPASHFVRVHKSYLVNLSKVDAIEGYSVLIEGNSIPVSRSNWRVLMGKLELI
jgi:DNA-binding LytR/AlgR family response regulator